MCRGEVIGHLVRRGRTVCNFNIEIIVFLRLDSNRFLCPVFHFIDSLGCDVTQIDVHLRIRIGTQLFQLRHVYGVRVITPCGYARDLTGDIVSYVTDGKRRFRGFPCRAWMRVDNECIFIRVISLITGTDCCLAIATQSDTVAQCCLCAVTDGDCVIPLSGRIRTDGHAVITFDNGTFTDGDTALRSCIALRFRAGTDDNRIG